MRAIIAIAVAVLVTGCQQVPKTEFSLNLKTGLVTIKSPKEIGFTNLVAEVEPNGKFKASIGSYSSHNSPDVLATVAGANVKMSENNLKLGELMLNQAAESAK